MVLPEESIVCEPPSGLPRVLDQDGRRLRLGRLDGGEEHAPQHQCQHHRQQGKADGAQEWSRMRRGNGTRLACHPRQPTAGLPGPLSLCTVPFASPGSTGSTVFSDYPVWLPVRPGVSQRHCRRRQSVSSVFVQHLPRQAEPWANNSPAWDPICNHCPQVERQPGIPPILSFFLRIHPSRTLETLQRLGKCRSTLLERQIVCSEGVCFRNLDRYFLLLRI